MEQEDRLELIRLSVLLVKTARANLRAAGAPKAAEACQRALKSVEGARRHAELAPYREERKKPEGQEPFSSCPKCTFHDDGYWTPCKKHQPHVLSEEDA